jgi:hypothetical protein
MMIKGRGSRGGSVWVNKVDGSPCWIWISISMMRRNRRRRRRIWMMVKGLRRRVWIR